MSPCGRWRRSATPPPVAALRYQHATAERSQAIEDYLDDVISDAQSPGKPTGPDSAASVIVCAISVPSRIGAKAVDTDGTTADLHQHNEAAPGFEPGYGALQAPA
jgi:hypothetical protein